MRAGNHEGFGGPRSYDWDTGRRPSQARQPMAGWLKVFLWTLGILLGVPAALFGLGLLICFGQFGLIAIAVVVGIVIAVRLKRT